MKGGRDGQEIRKEKKRKKKVNEKKKRQNITACGAEPLHGGTWVKAVWRYLGRS